MGFSKRIAQSWLFAGGLLLCLTAGPVLFYRDGLYEAPVLLRFIYVPLLLTAIFTMPSTVLNWLYEAQGHEASQRHWMKSPSGLWGKIGYIFTGSVTLWLLFGIGLVLAVLVIGGLMSLGQAAWST